MPRSPQKGSILGLGSKLSQLSMAFLNWPVNRPRHSLAASYARFSGLRRENVEGARIDVAPGWSQNRNYPLNDLNERFCNKPAIGDTFEQSGSATLKSPKTARKAKGWKRASGCQPALFENLFSLEAVKGALKIVKRLVPIGRGGQLRSTPT